MKTNILIKDLARELTSNLSKVEGIFFYGSRVQGNYKTDSDFDMIVVFKDDYSIEDEYKLAGIIIKIEIKYDVFIDYHPMTMKELERNPVFYDQVVNKGIYYEAA